MNQQQANYRAGNPIAHCGVCVYYQGKHKCSQVQGDISPFGFSDVYEADQNPFPPTLSQNEKHAIMDMARDSADRSGAMPRPQGPPMGSIAAPGPMA